MSTIDRLLDSIAVPRMLKVRQTFERPVITDVSGELHARLLAKNVLAKIRPGQKIAITCGSRGISNLPEMVRHFKKGEAFVVTTKKLTFALRSEVILSFNSKGEQQMDETQEQKQKERLFASIGSLQTRSVGALHGHGDFCFKSL